MNRSLALLLVFLGLAIGPSTSKCQAEEEFTLVRDIERIYRTYPVNWQYTNQWMLRQRHEACMQQQYFYRQQMMFQQQYYQQRLQFYRYRIQAQRRRLYGW